MGYNKWINIGDGVYVNTETIYNISYIEPEEELIQIISKEILDEYRNSKRYALCVQDFNTNSGLCY